LQQQHLAGTGRIWDHLADQAFPANVPDEKVPLVELRNNIVGRSRGCVPRRRHVAHGFGAYCKADRGVDPALVRTGVASSARVFVQPLEMGACCRAGQLLGSVDFLLCFRLVIAIIALRARGLGLLLRRRPERRCRRARPARTSLPAWRAYGRFGRIGRRWLWRRRVA